MKFIESLAQSKIKIYDVTLRDGFQRAGMVKQEVDMKIRIAHLLDRFGLDIIEGGWPGSTEADTEFFRKMQGEKLSHAILAAFGSTARIGVNPEDDKTMDDLLGSGAKCVTLVGKSSLRHATEALGATGGQNIDTVARSIQFMKRYGRIVYLDAEHFYDGFKEDPSYSEDVISAAVEAGVDGVTLCDTNGGSMPEEIYGITKKVKARFSKLELGIHAHNDSETAVANTLAAVRAGAGLVQGTINGYGERPGNANLCSILPNLVYKYGYRLNMDLRRLTNLANGVASEVGIPLPDDMPYAGKNAFAHKAGLHVSAVGKDPSLYEHIKPEWVGNKRRIVMSEYGGKANVRETAKTHGFTLSEEDIRILSSRLEENGELGEAQNYLLIHRYLGLKEPFEIIRRKVIDADDLIQAILKIKVNGVVQLVSANGTGSLNAFDNALKKAISPEFPDVNTIRLTGYKSVVPEDTEKYGTDATVTVTIVLSSNGDKWTTVTRGPDQDKANQKALSEGYAYYLIKKGFLKEKAGLNVEPTQVK